MSFFPIRFHHYTSATLTLFHRQKSIQQPSLSHHAKHSTAMKPLFCCNNPSPLEDPTKQGSTQMYCQAPYASVVWYSTYSAISRQSAVFRAGKLKKMW